MSEPTDFFVAGGTLRATDPSYVTRPADDHLLQQLQDGEFSLRAHPAPDGQVEPHGAHGPAIALWDGTCVAIVDLTAALAAAPVNFLEISWYLGLLSRVRAQLRLVTDVELWWDEHAALGIAQRFITFLHDVLLTGRPEPVVILIDEIDLDL